MAASSSTTPVSAASVPAAPAQVRRPTILPTSRSPSIAAAVRHHRSLSPGRTGHRLLNTPTAAPQGHMWTRSFGDPSALPQPPRHQFSSLAQPPPPQFPVFAQPPRLQFSSLVQPPFPLLPVLAQPPRLQFSSLTQPPRRQFPTLTQPPPQFSQLSANNRSSRTQGNINRRSGGGPPGNMVRGGGARQPLGSGATAQLPPSLQDHGKRLLDEENDGERVTKKQKMNKY